MSNYNSLVSSYNERTTQCPYEKSHDVPTFRFARHIEKCRRSYEGNDIKTCKFNVTHRIPAPEYNYHMQTCADRLLIETRLVATKRQSAEDETENGRSKRPRVKTSAVDDDEDWDNCPQQTYNPKKRLENSNIITHIQHMTKSKREEERLKRQRKILESKHPHQAEQIVYNVDASTSSRTDEAERSRSLSRMASSSVKSYQDHSPTTSLHDEVFEEPIVCNKTVFNPFSAQCKSNEMQKSCTLDCVSAVSGDFETISRATIDSSHSNTSDRRSLDMSLSPSTEVSLRDKSRDRSPSTSFSERFEEISSYHGDERRSHYQSNYRNDSRKYRSPIRRSRSRENRRNIENYRPESPQKYRHRSMTSSSSIKHESPLEIDSRSSSTHSNYCYNGNRSTFHKNQGRFEQSYTNYRGSSHRHFNSSQSEYVQPSSHSRNFSSSDQHSRHDNNHRNARYRSPVQHVSDRSPRTNSHTSQSLPYHQSSSRRFSYNSRTHFEDDRTSYEDRRRRHPKTDQANDRTYRHRGRSSSRHSNRSTSPLSFSRSRSRSRLNRTDSFQASENSSRGYESSSSIGSRQSIVKAAMEIEARVNASRSDRPSSSNDSQIERVLKNEIKTPQSVVLHTSQSDHEDWDVGVVSGNESKTPHSTSNEQDLTDKASIDCFNNNKSTFEAENCSKNVDRRQSLARLFPNVYGNLRRSQNELKIPRNNSREPEEVKVNVHASVNDTKTDSLFNPHTKIKEEKVDDYPESSQSDASTTLNDSTVSSLRIQSVSSLHDPRASSFYHEIISNARNPTSSHVQHSKPNDLPIKIKEEPLEAEESYRPSLEFMQKLIKIGRQYSESSTSSSTSYVTAKQSSSESSVNEKLDSGPHMISSEDEKLKADNQSHLKRDRQVLMNRSISATQADSFDDEDWDANKIGSSCAKNEPKSASLARNDMKSTGIDSKITVNSPQVINRLKAIESSPRSFLSDSKLTKTRDITSRTASNSQKTVANCFKIMTNTHTDRSSTLSTLRSVNTSPKTVRISSHSMLFNDRDVTAKVPQFKDKAFKPKVSNQTDLFDDEDWDAGCTAMTLNNSKNGQNSSLNDSKFSEARASKLVETKMTANIREELRTFERNMPHFDDCNDNPSKICRKSSETTVSTSRNVLPVGISSNFSKKVSKNPSVLANNSKTSPLTKNASNTQETFIDLSLFENIDKNSIVLKEPLVKLKRIDGTELFKSTHFSSLKPKSDKRVMNVSKLPSFNRKSLNKVKTIDSQDNQRISISSATTISLSSESTPTSSRERNFSSSEREFESKVESVDDDSSSNGKKSVRIAKKSFAGPSSKWEVFKMKRKQKLGDESTPKNSPKVVKVSRCSEDSPKAQTKPKLLKNPFGKFSISKKSQDDQRLSDEEILRRYEMKRKQQIEQDASLKTSVNDSLMDRIYRKMGEASVDKNV